MINEEKTEIFGIGDIEKPKEKKFQEKLKDRVCILGVFFCRNKQNETKENIQKARDIIKKIKESHGN